MQVWSADLFARRAYVARLSGHTGASELRLFRFAPVDLPTAAMLKKHDQVLPMALTDKAALVSLRSSRLSVGSSGRCKGERECRHDGIIPSMCWWSAPALER